MVEMGCTKWEAGLISSDTSVSLFHCDASSFHCGASNRASLLQATSLLTLYHVCVI